MPFCSSCGAPQIRVAAYEGGPGEQIAGPATGAPSVPFASSSGIQWSIALRPTIASGLIGAVLMFTPFGVLGIGMLLAGVASVYLYRRRMPWTSLSTGAGAKLGIASGMFGSIIFAWIGATLVLIFNRGGQLRSLIIQALDQSAARNPDPEAQQMLQYLKTPQGIATAAILVGIFLFIFFVLLAGVGGALGAAFARRREQR